MLLSHALLAPHVPTLLVDQHRGHQTAMLDALARASERMLAEIPAAAVVLSARWESSGPFLVGADPRHSTLTDYTGFGVEVRYDCRGEPRLARALADGGRAARLRVATTSRGIDSGITVPMRFLAPHRELSVVPLSLAPQPTAVCRAWGASIRKTLAEWPDTIAFVVGGALSGNRHAWNLRRDVPEAQAFDERCLEALAAGRWDDVALPSGALAEKIQPEAELRHLEVLRGFLGADPPGEVLCYEPGPGVGAALIAFTVGERGSQAKDAGTA